MPHVRPLLVWLLAGLLLCTAAGMPRAAAQERPEGASGDRAPVEVRRPPAGALDRYRTDPDFIYERPPPAAASWWNAFVTWLSGFFPDLTPVEEGQAWSTVEVILQVLAALAVVYAVLRLVGVDATGIFRRGSRTTAIPFDDVEDDVEGADFERLVREAAGAGDYRRAVRLRYLQALQHLTRRDLVQWQRDKTNRAYVRELRAAGLDDAFADLTRLFEQVWYGDAPVDRPRYDRVLAAFEGFDRRLEGQAGGPAP